jgi:hypothetical protein
MIHLDPQWFEAAGTDALVVKAGVDMLNHRKKNGEPTAPAPVAETPAVAAVPALSGITGTEYMLGIMVPALALLGAALIIHHGLTV